MLRIKSFLCIRKCRPKIVSEQKTEKLDYILLYYSEYSKIEESSCYIDMSILSIFTLLFIYINLEFISTSRYNEIITKIIVSKTERGRERVVKKYDHERPFV